MVKAAILLVLLLWVINCDGQPKHYQHSHSHVLELTDPTFQDVLDQTQKLLVKFFAPWCGHCVHLAPIYQEVAHQLAHSGQTDYVIAKIDCTIEKETCSKQQIRGYPTIKYFIYGEAHLYEGQRSKQAIIQFLKSKPYEIINSKARQEL